MYTNGHLEIKVLSMTLISNNEYQDWLARLKAQVRSSQQKASLAVNSELIKLYWSIGKQILDKQNQSGWGAKVVDQLATDLKIEFPEMKGFSPRNLKYMRRLAETWDDISIVQQLVAQLPWGHNIALLEKLSSEQERMWYARSTITNGWSRNVLIHQIESGLMNRQGNAVNNFAATLPEPQSELAIQTFKDPYCFDFLQTDSKVREREIENALVKHVTKFLLELGRGFALVGQQYRLVVGGDEFFIDLLFYHLELRCYVVIELKGGDFKPEHLGQLSFYLSAVDGEIKRDDDAPTIGLLLCRKRNQIVAEYATKAHNSPLSVAEYMLTENLPRELQEGLPTIEDIEASLSIELKGEQGDD